jgi:hypothetical protein
MDGLHIALNVMELRFLLASLPAELAARVDLLLRRVARLLESRIEEAALPAARLQVALDNALEHAVAAAQPKAALALAGLRRALLPHAPAPCITAPAGAPALEHAA